MAVKDRRSLVETLRQHHGIEHATVNLLVRRHPGLRVVARSDLAGFVVYGEVRTEDLTAAVVDALALMQAGRSDLAVHPNCGTNLVTAGVLSGVAAFIGASGGRRSLWDRVPGAVLGATLALLVAGPAGRWMQQKVTTSTHVQGLRVVSVTQISVAPFARHRVVISG